MSLDDALRGFAGQIGDGGGQKRRSWRGVIATVVAGASLDGNAAVSVTVNGSTIPAPYLASYTPVVGHVVMVELVNGSPYISGRLIGFPVV